MTLTKEDGSKIEISVTEIQALGLTDNFANAYIMSNGNKIVVIDSIEEIERLFDAEYDVSLFR